jgi:hypothetical protein
MTLQWTARKERYLAAGLLLLIVLAVSGAIAWPTMMLHRHYEYHIEQSTDHLTRYQRIAALRPELESAMVAVEKRNGRRHYLKATSPTLAAAELQGLVTRLIESREGRIISSQILPTKEDAKAASGPSKISLSVQLTAATVPLQMILHSIEALEEPYLFIDQLTVRPNQGRAYRPQPGIQPDLSVAMTVSAYTLGGSNR